MAGDLIEPIAGRHAVQRALVGLDFASELSESHLAALADQTPQLAEIFPERRDVKQIVLNFGEAATSPINKLGGYQFVKADKVKAPVRLFSVSANQVLVSVEDYENWRDFRAVVDRCLRIALPIVALDRQFKSASLQYFDAFKWRGDKDLVSAREFLRPDAPWIAPGVFDLGKSPWHVHSGFFAIDPPFGDAALLENVKLNFRPIGDTPALQINTIHQFNPLGETSPDTLGDFVLDKLDALHERNKAFLRGLLRDELCQLIKLDGDK